MIDPAVLLALISSIYAQLIEAQAEIERLRALVDAGTE